MGEEEKKEWERKCAYVCVRVRDRARVRERERESTQESEGGRERG